MSQPGETRTVGNLTSHGLTERVLPIIEAGVDAELPEFNEIALDVFSYQYANNEPYREFCDAEGAPRRCRRWRDIPAYDRRLQDARRRVLPDRAVRHAIMTSGTTSRTSAAASSATRTARQLVFTANRVMTGAYLFPDFGTGHAMPDPHPRPEPEFAPSMGMAIGMDQTRQALRHRG